MGLVTAAVAVTEESKYIYIKEGNKNEHVGPATAVVVTEE